MIDSPIIYQSEFYFDGSYKWLKSVEIDFMDKYSN